MHPNRFASRSALSRPDQPFPLTVLKTAAGKILPDCKQRCGRRPFPHSPLVLHGVNRCTRAVGDRLDGWPQSRERGARWHPSRRNIVCVPIRGVSAESAVGIARPHSCPAGFFPSCFISQPRALRARTHHLLRRVAIDNPRGVAYLGQMRSLSVLRPSKRPRDRGQKRAVGTVPAQRTDVASDQRKVLHDRRGVAARARGRLVR